MTFSKIFILGATSAIGSETAKLLAPGAHFYLLGRDAGKLKALEEVLLAQGAASVGFSLFDARNFASHQGLIEKAKVFLGSFDLVLLCHGVLEDQKTLDYDVEKTLELLEVNFLSSVSLLTRIATQLERQKKGSLAVVTSVAGDLGRRSNYVYGASKGGLSLFLQGLRARLHSSHVHVLTIKPGLVDTPMTAHRKKNFLFAKKETLAKGIVRALKQKKEVVYLPSFWKYLLYLPKILPESFLKRLTW